jgi:hypothetical protein
MPKITDAMRWLVGDDGDEKRPVRRSGNRRHPTGTTTLTFAKPYCSPARGIIEPVLQKYGVKMHSYVCRARRQPMTSGQPVTAAI